MEPGLRFVENFIALGVELIAAFTVAIGAAEAVVGIARGLVSANGGFAERKRVWVRFAAWLVLALEFELGADIVRTALSPTWQDLAKLGAIAFIRTFLNFFLTKDVESVETLATPAAQR